MNLAQISRYGWTIWLIPWLGAGCAAPAVMPTDVPRATLTASPTPVPTIMPTATERSTATPLPTATARVIEPPSGIEATRDIAFAFPAALIASEWLLDVYSPAEEGDWPIVVILHGAGGSKNEAELQLIAHDIAGEGALVVVPNNRPESGEPLFRDDWPGIREYLENTACAIRFARANGPEYGGNPEQVVVIGHSGGGYAGMWVALVADDLEMIWDAFASDHSGPSKQVDCVAGDDVSARPDVFIGFAGAYVYFEQFAAEDPELFELVNPATYIGRNKALMVRILEATRDETRPRWANESTRQLYEQLAEAGYDVELEEVVAAHGLGRGAREAVIRVLWETIGQSY